MAGNWDFISLVVFPLSEYFRAMRFVVRLGEALLSRSILVSEWERTCWGWELRCVFVVVRFYPSYLIIPMFANAFPFLCS